MKFVITEELIKKGRVVSFVYLYCPVALAIREKGFNSVKVLGSYAVIEDKKYILPLKVKTFILNFDARNKVKPFEFSLDMRKTK